MKYFITLLGGLLLLVGCNDVQTDTDVGRYCVVRIDGCEYVASRYGAAITHKANCTNHVQIPPPPAQPAWQHFPGWGPGYCITNLNLGVAVTNLDYRRPYLEETK